MPSSLRGRGKFRRLLKALPESVRAELGHEMLDGGRRILRTMKGKAPRRTGGFAGGLALRFSAKTLKLRLGFFASRKRIEPWYARIVDLGRTAQVANVTRRIGRYRGPVGRLRPPSSPNAGTAMGSAYKLRVKGRAGAKVVTGGYADLRAELGRRLKGVLDKSLKRIAGGG